MTNKDKRLTSTIHKYDKAEIEFGSKIIFYLLFMSVILSTTIGCDLYMGYSITLNVFVLGFGIYLLGFMFLLPFACTLIHYPGSVSNEFALIFLLIIFFVIVVIFMPMNSIFKIITQSKYRKEDGFVFWPWKGESLMVLLTLVIRSYNSENMSEERILS